MSTPRASLREKVAALRINVLFAVGTISEQRADGYNKAIDRVLTLLDAEPRKRRLETALRDLLAVISADDLIPESVSYMRQAREALLDAEPEQGWQDSRGYTLPEYVAVVSLGENGVRLGVQLEAHTNEQDWELTLDAEGNIRSSSLDVKLCPSSPAAEEK